MLSRRVGKAMETQRSLVDGEHVFRQGDDGGEMYVIQSGNVVISKNDVVIRKLERGEFFGEMSLLESMPRDADARAIGETRLLVITSGALLLRLRRDPSFALEMLRVLSTRIRELTALLEA